MTAEPATGEARSGLGATITRLRANRGLSGALNAADAALRRFVHFTVPEQSWAVALWAAHTHVADRIDLTPRLAVRAPTRQSGKTRLLEVLTELVADGWYVVNPSAAVLYRAIDAKHPTILLDEADRLFERKAEDQADIVSVINAGNVRGATVPRIVGQGTKMQVHDFAAYAPMALAGIAANWPDTVLDRSILITLERKKPDEEVARFRQRQKWFLRGIGEELGGLLADVERLQVDSLPDELSDRAQDAWEPLIAIADAAGFDWPARARQAALSLGRTHARLLADDERDELQLLNDLVALFEALEPESGFLGSSQLVNELTKLDDRPWSDWPGGFSTHKLAKLMRRLGIRPTQPFGSAKRGYDRRHVTSVWERVGSRTD